MEEPGGLQSMGSQRVWHDWATSLSLSTSVTYFNGPCNPSSVIKLKLKFPNGRTKTSEQIFKPSALSTVPSLYKNKNKQKNHKTCPPQTKTKQAKWNVDLSYLVLIILKDSLTFWESLILYLLIPPMTGNLCWHLLLGMAPETWKSSPEDSESWEIGPSPGVGNEERWNTEVLAGNQKTAGIFFFLHSSCPRRGAKASFFSISVHFSFTGWEGQGFKIGPV